MIRSRFCQHPKANRQKRLWSFLRLIPYPLSLIPLFVLPAFSQQTWQRTYGGTGDDYGHSVQQTSDGGYIVAGGTTSFGDSDQVYLIKTNASGDTLWTRTYGGTGNDYGYSVQQTTDGGYIIAGFVGDSLSDVYLVKTDASGDTLWTRTYGGAEDEYGFSVQQTTDGGYIIAGDIGDSLSDVYLIKTNASGDTLWTRTYGSLWDNQGGSVQQTSDGGYIVAGGATHYMASSDVYLIKTNASGDTLWTRTYGSELEEEYGSSVQQTSDGGYIVAGGATISGLGWHVYLVKINASGDTLWTKTYGGTGWGDYEGYSVQQTSDGGYIVAGTTRNYSPDNYDVYLIKTNTSGDTLWTKTYGGVGDEEGYSVQQTTDGGYIIAGYTTSFGAGGNDVYLIKTDANGNVGVENNPSRLTPHTTRLTVSPNPFTSFASIPGHASDRFALYDISGRKVGTYRGDRIGEGLASGVYFLRPEGKDAKPLRVVKLR